MTTPPTGGPAKQSTHRPVLAPTGSGDGRAPAGAPRAFGALGSTVATEVVETREPAEVIRDAVLAVPGVADLHGGPFGTVATYLPGRRVSGVAVRDDGSVEISLVAAATRGLATDLQALAARVRRTAAALVDGPVSVTVADLATNA